MLEPTATRRDRTRRDVLRLGAGTAGLAATGSLAGCFGLFGGPPGYTKWVHDPGAVADRSHVQFRKGKFNIVRRHDDEVGSALNNYRAAQQEWPLVTLNLQFSQVKEGFTFAPRSGRVTGDFDAQTAGSALTNKNYEESEGYGDYSVYRTSSRAVGVANGEAIYCDDTEFNADFDPRSLVEAAIDAQNGDADRFVDTSDAFRTLTTTLGDTTLLVGATFDPPDETSVENGQFANAVAAGQSVKINGDNSKVKGVVVFDSEGDAATEAVSEWAANTGFSNVGDLSTSQKGAAVVVSGSAPTGDVDLPSVF